MQFQLPCGLAPINTGCKCKVHEFRQQITPSVLRDCHGVIRYALPTAVGRVDRALCGHTGVPRLRCGVCAPCSCGTLGHHELLLPCGALNGFSTDLSAQGWPDGQPWSRYFGLTAAGFVVAPADKTHHRAFFPAAKWLVLCCAWRRVAHCQLPCIQ